MDISELLLSVWYFDLSESVCLLESSLELLAFFPWVSEPTLFIPLLFPESFETPFMASFWLSLNDFSPLTFDLLAFWPSASNLFLFSSWSIKLLISEVFDNSEEAEFLSDQVSGFSRISVFLVSDSVFEFDESIAL